MCYHRKTVTKVKLYKIWIYENETEVKRYEIFSAVMKGLTHDEL